MEKLTPTPLYKVVFKITGTDGIKRDRDTFFFDDLNDAQRCAKKLAHQRLRDTRDLALSRHQLEMIKRCRKSDIECRAYDVDQKLRIEHEYPVDCFSSPYRWGPTVHNMHQFEVRIFQKKFFLRFCDSIVQPRAMEDLKRWT